MRRGAGGAGGTPPSKQERGVLQHGFRFCADSLNGRALPCIRGRVDPHGDREPQPLVPQQQAAVQAPRTELEGTHQRAAPRARRTRRGEGMH